MGGARGWLAVCVVFGVAASACGGGSEVATPTTTADEDVGSSDEGEVDDPSALGEDASSATIGAGGGSVTSQDGVLTVDVPAGALSEDTLVSISPAADFAVPDLGDGEILGIVYDLGPDGLTFDEPVTVSFALDGAIDEVPLALPVSMTADGATEGLSALAISNDGSVTTISAQTSHFSYVFVITSGATVAMTPARPSRLVGDGWVSEVGILWASSTAVGLTGLDGIAEDLAVLDELGTTEVGDRWEAVFDCVAPGRSEFAAIGELELTNVIAQFFASLLPGYSGSATVTLVGEAECVEPDTTAPTGGDCPPAVFADPDANGRVGVTIMNECLDPLFFAFNDSNAADPFWHIHTQQDDIFLSLELYTIFGSSWSGQTGTFPLNCNEPWGLCAIFDPDGVGPDPAVMWADGEITISQLADGSYDVSFAGLLPPATDGTVYDLQPVGWSS